MLLADLSARASRSLRSKGGDAVVLCEASAVACEPPSVRRDVELPRILGRNRFLPTQVRALAKLPHSFDSDPNRPLYQKRQRLSRGCSAVPYRLGRSLPKDRERVLLLGSGWSSIYFLNQIDPTKYDVTVISPRPFFVFTPLLPTALGGVLSTRAVIEPIRNFLLWAGKKSMDYQEGRAYDVDFEKKEVICTSKTGETFRVPYDRLVCAVGSETNTFGIPGVREHASFLKEVEDAREIRLKVMNAFEAAALPSTSAEDRERLLRFVVVGGGPAGVEAAGEMHDMIKNEIAKYYPELSKLAKVTVIEMLPELIPMFGPEMAKFTKDTFTKIGIECLMEHRVTKCSASAVTVASKDKTEKTVPCSVIVWASGVGQVDLIKTIMAKIPEQATSRAMMVTPDLKIKGTKNVYAVGDCAYITPKPLAAIADELFEASTSSSMGAGISWLEANHKDLLKEGYVQVHPTQCDFKKYRDGLNREEFKEMILTIDKAYRAPVPTAQMARQAGAYLGAVLNARQVKPLPYAPTNYGHMSYIGGGKAVVELTRERGVPKPKSIRMMGGRHVSLFWHGYYWLSQTSSSNRALALFDYSKKFLKGREITEAGLTSTADRVNKKDDRKPS